MEEQYYIIGVKELVERARRQQEVSRYRTPLYTLSRITLAATRNVIADVNWATSRDDFIKLTL